MLDTTAYRCHDFGKNTIQFSDFRREVAGREGEEECNEGLGGVGGRGGATGKDHGD